MACKNIQYQSIMPFHVLTVEKLQWSMSSSWKRAESLMKMAIAFKIKVKKSCMWI